MVFESESGKGEFDMQERVLILDGRLLDKNSLAAGGTLYLREDMEGQSKVR